MNMSSLQSRASDPSEIKCRHCGSTQVRPSVKSTGKGTRVTYRCQSCKRHFRVGTNWLNLRLILLGTGLLAFVLIGVMASQLFDKPADRSFEPEAATVNQGALSRLQKEAEQGKSEAQYELGRTYWLDAEYQKAFPLIKTAAAQGHIEAEYLLGLAYLNGLGTLQNYRAAMEFLSKAAQNGHLEAEYRLGILYRDGLASPPDKEAAYLWLNIAAARGHADALQFRDKLAAVMTTEEINRAQEASTLAHAKLSGAPAAKP